MAITTMVGARIQRREDPRLIQGHGQYIDDFVRPHTAYAAVVRSPHAHARIRSIDVTDARNAQGVVAVLTAADFKKVLAGFMPVAPAFVPEKKTVPDRFPIAESEVCFQGEPVAVVIADTKYHAADAAEQVIVDYEPLPAVMDLEKALEPGAAKVHEGAPDNVGWDMTFSPDAEAAFAEAEVTLKHRILQQRLAPTPMEGRGVIAEWRRADQAMTVWLSSQSPHFIRLFVGGAMGIPENRFRVISPDVGGGFGSKISPYPEDYLVPAAAKILGRPVKWTETRTENLQNATHGRGQIFDVEIAGNRDGQLLGLKITQYLDLGAYIGTFGAFQTCACLLPGAYVWKQVASRTVGVLTNRVPTDPYRGAGRPEATHLVERMVDLFAREIGMDPVAVRRRNFITAFPQIVADELGVPVDAIELRHGDTAEGPAFGYGTYGSRSLAVGGMAVLKASRKVRDKAKKIAAQLFEAAEEDVVFDQGHFYVKGSPENRKAFGEVAFAAYGAGLPEDVELGLEAVAYFDPPNFVWPFGAHICVVEVDPETGGVEMLKYVAVDDCGNVINPMIVEGQIHGGIVQGIAQALFEEVVYTEDGTLRTGTLLDYSVPTANEIPTLTLDRTVTPTPTNELGVKGIGEAGTIAASAAVINAICDALAPLGIEHVDMPASPDRLWKQMKEAKA